MINKANLTLVASRAAKRMLTSRNDRKQARAFILDLTLDSFQRGNFSVVTLSDLDGVAGVGVSKRCPSDNLNDNIGYNIALVRAVEHAIELYAAEAGWSVPLTSETIDFDRLSNAV